MWLLLITSINHTTICDILVSPLISLRDHILPSFMIALFSDSLPLSSEPGYKTYPVTPTVLMWLLVPLALLHRLMWRILTCSSFPSSLVPPVWSTFSILDRCSTSHLNTGTTFAHWISAFQLAFGGSELFLHFNCITVFFHEQFNSTCTFLISELIYSCIPL